MYILENKQPVKVDDITVWSFFYQNKKNIIVEQTTIGDIKVSTVFLGIDHSFDEGYPILFETMIFGGEHDQYQERYRTWDEAVKGHHEACEMVINS